MIHIIKLFNFWTLGLFLPALVFAQQSKPFAVADLQSDDVIVGQPVVLNVQVYVPSWFSGAPDFPDISVPNAIVTPPGRSYNLNKNINGQNYAGIQRGYTIYPQIPGEYEIPSFTVQTRYALENAQPSPPEAVKVQALRFRARIPEAAKGLPYFISAKKLRITQTIEPKADTLQVSDALKRTISITVTEALSIVIPPLAFDSLPGLSLYQDSPTVSDEGGERGSKIYGKRIESATYVLQDTGDYKLPPIELSWWDLSAGRLRRSKVPSVKFNVIENPDSSVFFPMEKDSTMAAAEPVGPGKSQYFSLAAILIVAGIIYLLLRRYAPLIKSWFAAVIQRRRESEAAYFSLFRKACRRNDAKESLNTLLLWLDNSNPSGSLSTTASLVKEAGDPLLSETIFALMIRLYGRTESAHQEWQGKNLYKIVKGFRKRIRPEDTIKEGLSLLNPS